MQLFDNILTTSNYAIYFKGIIQLEIDFTATNDVGLAKISDLDNFVTEYQEKIYRELFGEALYNYLYDNKASAVYTTLLAGEVVTDANTGYKYEWVGLRSMLSHFVYFYFKRSKEGYDSSVGEKKSNSQNSSQALGILRNKLKTAWNKGVDYYRDAIDYIDYKNEQLTDYYPEFLPKNNYSIYL